MASNRKNARARHRIDAQSFEMISAAENVMQVIVIVCYEAQKDYTGFGESKNFKVDFTSLRKCGTIEFRQHIATIDDKKISRWIRLVTFRQNGLGHSSCHMEVLFANKEEFRSTLREISRQPRITARILAMGNGSVTGWRLGLSVVGG